MGTLEKWLRKNVKSARKKISMYFTTVVTDLVWKNTTTSDMNCSSLSCTRLNLAWTLLKAFTTDSIVGVKKQKLVLPNSETFQFVYDFLQDSTLMVIYLTFILLEYQLDDTTDAVDAADSTLYNCGNYYT